MRILNGVLSVIFILFAALQYNDPDPLGWMLIYGLVAVVCAFAMLNKYNKWVIITGIVLCLVGAAYYMPGFIELVSEHEINDLARQMKADQPFIEEARESLGLLIAAAALIFQYFRMKKINHQEAV